MGLGFGLGFLPKTRPKTMLNPRPISGRDSRQDSRPHIRRSAQDLRWSFFIYASNKIDLRDAFCCPRAPLGSSGGLGIRKSEKCVMIISDDNFFDQMQLLCPYKPFFNRMVFNLIF